MSHGQGHTDDHDEQVRPFAQRRHYGAERDAAFALTGALYVTHVSNLWIAKARRFISKPECEKTVEAALPEPAARGATAHIGRTQAS